MKASYVRYQNVLRCGGVGPDQRPSVRVVDRRRVFGDLYVESGSRVATGPALDFV